MKKVKLDSLREFEEITNKSIIYFTHGGVALFKYSGRIGDRSQTSDTCEKEDKSNDTDRSDKDDNSYDTDRSIAFDTSHQNSDSCNTGADNSCNGDHY
jgi:hypothetical protein